MTGEVDEGLLGAGHRQTMTPDDVQSVPEPVVLDAVDPEADVAHEGDVDVGVLRNDPAPQPGSGPMAQDATLRCQAERGPGAHDDRVGDACVDVHAMEDPTEPAVAQATGSSPASRASSPVKGWVGSKSANGIRESVSAAAKRAGEISTVPAVRDLLVESCRPGGWRPSATVRDLLVESCRLARIGSVSRQVGGRGGGSGAEGVLPGAGAGGEGAAHRPCRGGPVEVCRGSAASTRPSRGRRQDRDERGDLFGGGVADHLDALCRSGCRGVC